MNYLPIFLVIIAVPLGVFVYARRDSSFHEFTRGEQGLALLLFTLLLYGSIGFVILAEMGIIFLASKVTGRIHFTDTLAMVSTVTVMIVVNTIVQTLLAILVDVSSKHFLSWSMPTWLILLSISPISVFLIVGVFQLMQQEISLFSAIVITFLSSVCSLLLDDRRV